MNASVVVGSPPSLDSWLDRLRRRAAEPLPGRAAQRRFEPDWAFGRHFDRPPPNARRAAVAVLVYPHHDAWHVPLTVRPTHLAAHAGQISLPGGSIEPGETPSEAAVRELHEELAVDPAVVQLLGPLTPLYIFGSGFYVEPWLLAADRRPPFVPQVDEVAELLETNVAELCDRSTWSTHRRLTRGIVHNSPHIGRGSHQVWGATAMILSEFVALCDESACGVDKGSP